MNPQRSNTIWQENTQQTRASATLLAHSNAMLSLLLLCKVCFLCETQPTAYHRSQVRLLAKWTSSSQAHHCRAGKDLATIGQQFPFEPLQYQATNLRLPFQEGIKMLQEAGWDVSQHTWFYTHWQLHCSLANSTTMNILKHSSPRFERPCI